MRTTLVSAMILGCSIPALAACGDDSETGAGGGSAASTSSATIASSAVGSTTSTGDSTASASSGGETGGGGGAGGEGGSGLACEPPLDADLDPDTSVRGPFTVGARTATVEGLTVEVWYPALGEGEAKTYDIRDHLPESERDKVADEDTALQTCDCIADLPLDEARGPLPVVLFVHGTAGFRSQSLEIVTHWASRGFVVVAADHPGLQLRNLLELACGQGQTPRDLDADLATLHSAILAPEGDLAFLAGHIDASRLALSGHSAGGAAIEEKGDIGRVLIPLAAGGVQAGEALESTLVMGSLNDAIVDFSAQGEGFETSPSPKRLVGLEPAGHLLFSSLCSLQNDAGQDIVEIGTEAGVCGVNLADGLFDCSDAYIDDEVGWSIIHEATSAVLEETLFCLPERGEWLAGIVDRHPEVAIFEEEL